MIDEADPQSDPIAALLDNLRAGLTRKQSMRAAGLTVKSLAALISARPEIREQSDIAEDEGRIAHGKVSDAGHSDARSIASQVQAIAEQRADSEPLQSQRTTTSAAQDPSAFCQRSFRFLQPEEPVSSASSDRASTPARIATTGVADPSGIRALAALVAEPKPSIVSDDRSKRASEATDDGAPDWNRIRNEAEEMAPGVMGWILWQEDRLEASGAGFPAMSPFSLHTLNGFFLSGKRWLLWLAGRGFGKSTLTSRVATAIGFGVERKAAPGPAWVCPIVSVLPVDADRRLEDIQQILLHAYLQEVKPSKSMIAAKDTNRCALAWVSSASTLGNVSGPSSFAALVDEEEKILYGRAGAIVGSLAFTFRSRPRVYGMRVSSAMTMDDTLARACEKGNGPKAPLTNFVTTLGPFVDQAIEGLLAVASWEESQGNVVAAVAIRAYAITLTHDSWQIPTWLGHPSIGNPDERLNWSAGDAAVATRIEAEAVDEKMLDGLPPWRYWLRECASLPTGGEVAQVEEDGELGLYGEEYRDAGVCSDERGY